MDKFPKQFITLGGLVLFLLLFGTAGYSLLEGASFLDSLFMTVITLSTVGFGEIFPLHLKGRIFTIILIMGGIGVLTYAVTSMITFLVEGELRQFFRRSKMQKQLAKMRDHYVVCGLGQTGRIIVDELSQAGHPFVVVDVNPEAVTLLDNPDSVLFVEGDATEDATLDACGVERACGLLAALDSDVDNLFIVLSARDRNPNLRIVARASSEVTVHKMRRAGADNVIAPNELGGRRMASVMTRPGVVSFLDVVTTSGDRSLRLEEAVIKKESRVCGKTLREVALPQRTGLIVIALRKQSTGEFVYNPQSGTRLECSDLMVVLGSSEQMVRLREVIA